MDKLPLETFLLIVCSALAPRVGSNLIRDRYYDKLILLRQICSLWDQIICSNPEYWTLLSMDQPQQTWPVI